MHMKHFGRLTLKIFGLIVLNDLLDSISQLLLKKGVLQFGMTNIMLSNIAEFASRSLTSWLVMAGLTVGILNHFLWLVILYRVDLSIAMPVGSTIYIFIPLLSIIFLNEHVTLLRWAGIFLIIAGIHLVAKSKVSPKGAA